MQLEFMLSNAFGGKLHYLVAISLTPIALVAYLLFPSLKKRIDKLKTGLNSKLEAEYQKVSRLFEKITMGNHPFLWLMLQFMTALIIPFFVLIAILRTKKVALDNSDSNRWIVFMKSLQVVPFNKLIDGHLLRV